MRLRLALLLLLAPIAVSAQDGRITFSRAVQHDFEIPERLAPMRDRIPSQTVSEMLLLFNTAESIMRPVPTPDEEEEPTGMNRRAAGLMARLKMGSSSRSDQETLLESYVSFDDGKMVETRELMGRTFLISDERPVYRWSLGGEQREFLDFVVQKATATHGGSAIEAWFTMEIPVQAGPGPYGGLPGMILLVSVDAGHTVYAATDVDLSGLGDGMIAPPDEGDQVSREEYEQIVAEKLEEVKTLRGQRRDRRRPPR